VFFEVFLLQLDALVVLLLEAFAEVLCFELCKCSLQLHLDLGFHIFRHLLPISAKLNFIIYDDL
jgi:hypothetical protein